MCMYLAVPTLLASVLLGTAIPTSPYNIHWFLYVYLLLSLFVAVGTIGNVMVDNICPLVVSGSSGDETLLIHNSCLDLVYIDTRRK